MRTNRPMVARFEQRHQASFPVKMADKVVVIVQQSLKPIKLIKWKVNEGNSISTGCVYLLYEVDDDDKHVVCKLKSTQAGTVYKLLAQEGDVVKPGATLLEIQACTHPTVMRDMCAECGADLRKDDVATEASVPMVHSVPELKVSLEQARKLGQADLNRLLKDRKLVLLVDLDQTLIHTTNDNIPANLKDVYHFQLNGAHSPWYHTRLRPGTHQFLLNMSPFFELHICTFGARNYAHMIAMFLDQDGKLFSQRILSRDECFNPTSKTANLTALFPCGDNMVCIIDDREDVWSYATNLIHVKPYHFFQHTGDINAPPGLDKHESDDKEGVDLTKVTNDKKQKVNGINKETTENKDTVYNGLTAPEIKEDIEKITNGDTIEEIEEEEIANKIPVRHSIEEDMPIFSEESQTECKNLEDKEKIAEGNNITIDVKEKDLEENKSIEKDESNYKEENRIERSKSDVDEMEIDVKDNIQKMEAQPGKEEINCKESNIQDKDNIPRSICLTVDGKEENNMTNISNNVIENETIVENSSSEETSNLKTSKTVEEPHEKEESLHKINCKEIKHIETDNSDANIIQEEMEKEVSSLNRIQESANEENMEEQSCRNQKMNVKEEQLNKNEVEENIDERILEDDANKESAKEENCTIQENKELDCLKEENINKNEDKDNKMEDACEKPDSVLKEECNCTIQEIKELDCLKEENINENEDKDNKMEDACEKPDSVLKEECNNCTIQEIKVLDCLKEENINENEEKDNKMEDACEKPDSVQKEECNKEQLCENKNEEELLHQVKEDDEVDKPNNNVEDNHTTVQNNFKLFSNIEKNNENKEDLIEIEDPDDYLLYLGDILKTIHKAFYDTYDKLEAGNVPDLKKVIPDVRRNVLQNTKLVFSGLVPTHIKLEQSRAFQVAKSLGATVTQDLQRDTTHLVAVRPGTAKVNVGRRKKNLKIVTPDWLWACAERWLKAEEKLYPLNNKGSKNRHPPPHCSSPEHASNFDVQDTRKRTPSGRFMDTINPLMTFSSADIADMDREVEDIFLESESDGESNKKPTEAELLESQLLTELKKSDDESSSSAESLTSEHPHGYKSGRKRLREEQDVEDESTADEYPSTKFRRGEELSSDLDIGQESNSEGSVDAPDEIDDGDWNMMGAALEREFLANN